MPDSTQPNDPAISFFGHQRKPPIKPAVGAKEGDTLADFELVRLIGEGGMGQVWEAEQVSLRRRVALKLVRPDRVSERTLDLFAREARAGGRLNHPGIVDVHAHGENNGTAWIAMEFVDGSWTLRDFLDDLAKQDEVPTSYYRDVAEFIAKLADALEAAHTAGVIHRDLKPQNVLITPADEPMVTDFGLARITDEAALSVTGDFAGSYYYMSPEQVAARRIGLDHRTDVFSLGVVMYEMLALRRPFEGDTAQQIGQQIVTKDPPNLRSLRSRVPKDLAVVAGKSLEKDRDRRYATMAEFAADLRRHLSDEPILARPAGSLRRLHLWARRNPTRTVAGAISTVAAFAIVILLGEYMHANTDLRITIGERDGAIRSLEDANTRLDSLNGELEEEKSNLAETNVLLDAVNDELQQEKAGLAETNERLDLLNEELELEKASLADSNQRLDRLNEELRQEKSNLAESNEQLDRVNEELGRERAILAEANVRLGVQLRRARARSALQEARAVAGTDPELAVALVKAAAELDEELKVNALLADLLLSYNPRKSVQLDSDEAVLLLDEVELGGEKTLIGWSNGEFRAWEASSGLAVGKMPLDNVDDGRQLGNGDILFALVAFAPQVREARIAIGPYVYDGELDDWSRVDGTQALLTDGRIVSGGRNGTLRSADGAELIRADIHDPPPSGGAFTRSADGVHSWIALRKTVIGRSGLFRLVTWDTREWERIEPQPEPAGFLTANRSGTRVAGIGGDGLVVASELSLRAGRWDDVLALEGNQVPIWISDDLILAGDMDGGSLGSLIRIAESAQGAVSIVASGALEQPVVGATVDGSVLCMQGRVVSRMRLERESFERVGVVTLPAGETPAIHGSTADRLLTVSASGRVSRWSWQSLRQSWTLETGIDHQTPPLGSSRVRYGNEDGFWAENSSSDALWPEEVGRDLATRLCGTGDLASHWSTARGFFCYESSAVLPDQRFIARSGEVAGQPFRDGRFIGWSQRTEAAIWLDANGLHLLTLAPTRQHRKLLDSEAISEATVCSSISDNRMVIWRPGETGPRVVTLDGGSSILSPIAFAVDSGSGPLAMDWCSTGKAVLFAWHDRLEVRDLSGGLRSSSELPRTGRARLYLDPSREKVAVASSTSVRIHDLQSGDMLLKESLSAPARSVAWSSQGTQVAIASSSRLLVYRLGATQASHVFELAAPVWLCSFADDGRSVVAWTDDGSLTFFPLDLLGVAEDLGLSLSAQDRIRYGLEEAPQRR